MTGLALDALGQQLHRGFSVRLADLDIVRAQRHWTGLVALVLNSGQVLVEHESEFFMLDASTLMAYDPTTE